MPFRNEYGIYIYFSYFDLAELAIDKWPITYPKRDYLRYGGREPCGVASRKFTNRIAESKKLKNKVKPVIICSPLYYYCSYPISQIYVKCKNSDTKKKNFFNQN